jgi:hypothetical protein
MGLLPANKKIDVAAKSLDRVRRNWQTVADALDVGITSTAVIPAISTTRPLKNTGNSIMLGYDFPLYVNNTDNNLAIEIYQGFYPNMSTGTVPLPLTASTSGPVASPLFLNGVGVWTAPSSQGYITSTSLTLFNTSTNGIVPSTGSTSTLSYYLDAEGVWSIPAGTTYNVFTESTNGLVSSTGSNSTSSYFLDAQDQWVIPSTYGYIVSSQVYTESTNGVVPAAPSSRQILFLSNQFTFEFGTSTWMEPPIFATGINGNDGYVPTSTFGGNQPSSFFLRADATWAAISTAGTTYNVFTESTNGLAPSTGSGSSTNVYFLNAAGTWTQPAGTTYNVFTESTNGLAPSTGSGSSTNVYFLNAAGTWTQPAGTTYNVFTTAVNGLVPAIGNSYSTNEVVYLLASNATWQGTFPQYSTSTILPTTLQNAGGFAVFNTTTLRPEIALDTSGGPYHIVFPHLTMQTNSNAGSAVDWGSTASTAVGLTLLAYTSGLPTPVTWSTVNPIFNLKIFVAVALKASTASPSTIFYFSTGVGAVASTIKSTIASSAVFQIASTASAQTYSTAFDVTLIGTQPYSIINTIQNPSSGIFQGQLNNTQCQILSGTPYDSVNKLALNFMISTAASTSTMSTYFYGFTVTRLA